MLRVQVPPNASGVNGIALPNPLDASTWTVGITGRKDQSMGVLSLSRLAKALGGKLEHTFIQFRTDDLGRHQYISLGEVWLISLNGGSGASGAGNTFDSLTVFDEEYVNEVSARLESEDDCSNQVQILSVLAPKDGDDSAASNTDDVCLFPPMGMFRNYTVCEDLTLGHTQRVMLSDATTLKSGIERNGIGIFNYLTLIVNCHEQYSASRVEKYKVRPATPEIIFEPIHLLNRYQPTSVVQAMDNIQEKLWHSLQKGSVVVHCLAGVHRAPTVVVCHYLYRHYFLGHENICNDVDAIYRHLSSIRPGVEPLSYIHLINIYHEHLKCLSQTAEKRS